MLLIDYTIKTSTGEGLDTLVNSFGLPSRLDKQKLFGGDLETDEEVRNRLMNFIYRGVASEATK